MIVVSADRFTELVQHLGSTLVRGKTASAPEVVAALHRIPELKDHCAGFDPYQMEEIVRHTLNSGR